MVGKWNLRRRFLGCRARGHKTNRCTTLDIVAMKRKGERIAALTAYDYTSAQMIDASGVPLILIGDTLGMVVQGEDTTLPVTLEQIIYHAKMVSLGARRALLVGDMPFMTYQTSPQDALRNAARLMTQGKVGAVKVEGGLDIAPTVERIAKAGIPVWSLGLTPQSTICSAAASRTRADRRLHCLQMPRHCRRSAAIVLELSPPPSPRKSQRIAIPTLGTARTDCDGEIQVFDLGLYTDFAAPHDALPERRTRRLGCRARVCRRFVAGVFPGRSKPPISRQWVEKDFEHC
jgi:3-methyl-2-oxobutanoate hydroxymethyltransferase